MYSPQVAVDMEITKKQITQGLQGLNLRGLNFGEIEVRELLKFIAETPNSLCYIQLAASPEKVELYKNLLVDFLSTNKNICIAQPESEDMAKITRKNEVEAQHLCNAVDESQKNGTPLTKEL